MRFARPQQASSVEIEIATEVVGVAAVAVKANLPARVQARPAKSGAVRSAAGMKEVKAKNAAAVVRSVDSAEAAVISSRAGFPVRHSRGPRR